MSGCEFCGYANKTAGKTLHIVRNEKQPKKKFELVQHLHLLQAQRNGEEKR